MKADIGTVLKTYRRKAKVTQKKMSGITGLSKNYISAVERNLHKPNGNMILQYIKICEIPLDAFF